MQLCYHEGTYSNFFTDSMNFTTSEYRAILQSLRILPNNQRDIYVADDEGGPFPLGKLCVQLDKCAR